MRSTMIVAGLVAPAMAALGAAPPQQSTVYSTEMVTITSCAATVTDCPARSTATSSTIHTLTQSTIYSTQYATVTSCGPTVTNCPASSTVVSSSSYIVSSTLVPAIPTTAVEAPTSSNSPVGGTAPPAVESPASSNSPVGGTAPPAAGSGFPTYSMTSVSPATTPGLVGAGSCVPSSSVRTYYETVTFPCSASAATPTGGAPASGTPPAGASTSGNSPIGASGTSVPHNATITSSSPTGIVTAGASTWGASGALAAVAGLVAMLA